MKKPLVIGLIVLAVLVIAIVIWVLTIGRDPTEGVEQAQTAQAQATEEVEAQAEDVVIPLSVENTDLMFTGSSAIGPQPGFFGELDGQVVLTPDGQLKGMTGEIDMASVVTQSEKLTKNLKAEPGLFDVETYPTSRFVMTEVRKAEPGTEATHMIVGNLTLHGQTLSVEFPATVTREEGKFVLSSEFSVNRQDFGIDFEGGTVFPEVRDKVLINLDIDAEVPAGTSATTQPAGA